MSGGKQQERVFSDAWYRVAEVRVALRHSVRAHRQQFQGEVWVVLRDTLSSDWYRVSMAGYRFLCRLSLLKTVEEVWQASLEEDGQDALTQEEVIHLLGQVNLSNLLQYDRVTAGASLFERYRKRRNKERAALWMGFLAIRIPLLDPDQALERSKGLIRWFLGPWGIALYLGLLATAFFSLITSDTPLFEQSAGILAPGNLVLLYVGFVVAKVVHELGHAGVCKHFGGEVHRMGVMMLLFAPLPYVDASASWGFRYSWQRIWVGLAGVVAELAVAAVAAIVWVHTAPGTLNALAYNVIFAASVSTVLFNLNPLLRFDGYYVLSDLLGVPNLFQRSRDQLKFLAQRFILRLPDARPAAQNRWEVLLLPLYGTLSLINWAFLMWSIIFFVAGQYLEFGIAMAWMLGIMMVVVPLVKLVRYLGFSTQLARYRGRAVGISSGLLLVTLGVLGSVPMPDRMRLDGVVEAEAFRPVRSEATGRIARVMAQPGTRVERGQLLLALENPQLAVEMRAIGAQLTQLKAQALWAMTKQMADLQPIEQQQEALEQHLADLQKEHDALLVQAPIAGVWSVPDEEATKGRWVARGDAIGLLVQPDQWRFVGVLPQIGSHLFEHAVNQAEVRIQGQENKNITTVQVDVIPHEHGVLPTPALGMPGGGKIAVDPMDPNGMTAAEPFFRIQAKLPDGGDVQWVHGRLGVMRLTLNNRPLLEQWERALRQFLQRRFRV
ncbi:hypothetical protein [Magnetococcus sp. PR-3]|uniref:hypothetical protein n=1 Tax=Magnetococcus sp. PR-3 TaxID=3120355 RepID=UPI002FCDFFAB